LLPDSFSTVPWASGPVFMFFAPGLVFLFCAPGLIFVGSRFHVLRSQLRFRRYSGPRVPFSCFTLPDSFSAVLGVSGPVFLFCTLGIIFRDFKDVGSRFHVLRSYSFSTVPRALSPIFMFCAPELIFDGTDGVGSLFHVLRSQTRSRRYRGRQDPFSCFALPNSFSAVPWVSDPVFMFCAP
jgi:hypothetical protein